MLLLKLQLFNFVMLEKIPLTLGLMHHHNGTIWLLQFYLEFYLFLGSNQCLCCFIYKHKSMFRSDLLIQIKLEACKSCTKLFGCKKVNIASFQDKYIDFTDLFSDLPFTL